MPKKSFFKRFATLIVSSVLVFSLAVTPLGTAYYYNANYTAPQITNLKIQAYDVNFKTQNVQASYYLTQNSYVNVTVQQGTSLVKTILTNDFQGAGYNTVTWDGTDKYGNFVGDGSYSINVKATNNAGSDYAAQYVTADYIPPSAFKGYNAPTTVYPAYSKPNYNTPSVGQNAVMKKHYASVHSLNPYKDEVVISYELSENSEVTMEILGNGFTAKTLMTDAWKSGNTLYTTKWNGKNKVGQMVQAGAYKYRITLANGNQYYGDINVDYVEPPVYQPPYIKVPTKKVAYNEPYYKYPYKYSEGDINVYGEQAVPSAFNPSQTTTKITYQLNNNADVSVNVYNGYAHVKTLRAKKEQSKGKKSLYWDGTDSSGVRVDPGVYTVKIDAEKYNAYDSEEIYIEIQYDYRGKNYLSVKPRISKDTVKPQTFNPYTESTKVSFHTSDNGYVTVKIMDGNNVVKTLLNNDYQTEGNHGRIWDGKNENDQYVPEGVYQYMIQIYNQDGESETKGNVIVDYEGYNYNKYNQTQPPQYNVVYAPQQVYPTYNQPKVAVKTRVKVAANGDYYNYDYYDYTVTPAQPCAGFSDVNTASKYCEAVEFVKDKGIFNGYDNGRFYPNKAIQRDEAVKVAMSTFGLGTMSSDGTNLGFWDVDPYAWYIPYLKAARTLGIVHGYPNGMFKPYETVNRVEFTKMFLETARNAHGIAIPYCNDKPYVDTQVTWYTDYVCYAKDHGLIQTVDPFHYQPGKIITRGEVAEFIYNYFGK